MLRCPSRLEGNITTVSETVPTALQPQVDAALAWFNVSQASTFEVTGIVDPEVVLAGAAGSTKDLRLVLCGAGRCEQRSFRVAAHASGFEVELLPQVAQAPGVLPAELDPPPGPLRTWLDDQLAAHDFVLLVFYRGFW